MQNTKKWNHFYCAVSPLLQENVHGFLILKDISTLRAGARLEKLNFAVYFHVVCFVVLFIA